MNTKHYNPLYRVLCAITIVVLVSLACGTTSTPTPSADPAAVPVEAAPDQTAAPVIPVSTEPVRIPPAAIGSNEITPPSATVIILQVDEADLAQVSVAIEQHKANEAGFSAGEVFVGGLLQLVLMGLEKSWCESISDNVNRHLLDENGKRLRRMGGWTGVSRFIDALIKGEFEVKAVISSYSKWRVALLMVVDGQDYLMVLSTESASTIVPLSVLKSDLDDWLLNRSQNFIRIGADGRIIEGMVFGGKEIGQILQTGIYALNGVMITQIGVSLARVGKCLDVKVRATESYKSWEANGKPDRSKIEVLYESELDLVVDMQTLQELGLRNNLVNNAEAERDGVLLLSIGGMVIGAWILAPVIIPAGAYGLAEETTRYALMIGLSAP